MGYMRRIDMITFDEKISILKGLGFKETKVGLSSERYAFLWHQVDELTDKQFNDFIKEITI